MNVGILELLLFGFVVALLVVVPFAWLFGTAVGLRRERLRQERYRQFYEALWDATGADGDDAEPELRQAACLLQLAMFPEFLGTLGPVVEALEKGPARGAPYRAALLQLRQAYQRVAPTA